ncbi:MAG: phospholipase D-like domain-containing protein [Pyrinomonadaceae bacterium]
MIGLKTHCKVALVVRREEDRLRRYVHVATGNYNPTTSRVYTDLGLLTTDEEVALTPRICSTLTGYSRQSDYRWKPFVAPVNVRERFMSLIERETAHQRAGRKARIIVKINSLTDVRIIRALYEASQAGVPIDLIIRGVCMLRPGVPGLSETIKVRSIVGRLLEHSRIFYFGNGGDQEVLIGSADWMSRNLDHRVEVVVPIKDDRLKERIESQILAAYLKDTVKARMLMPDGTYDRLLPADGEEPFNCQEYFVEL